MNFACHFAFNYSNTSIHPLTHTFVCTGDYTVHHHEVQNRDGIFSSYRFFDQQFLLLSLLPFHFISLQFSLKLKANRTNDDDDDDGDTDEGDDDDDKIHWHVIFVAHFDR